MKKTSLELTPAQIEIFEKNKGLIGKTIKHYINNEKYTINEYADLNQIGSIGLIKAIKTYNGEGSAFSTYAIRVMRNELYNETRKFNDETDKKKCELDDPYIESNASMKYNNIDGFYDSYFKEQQDEILSKMAKKYGGIAENGVNALMLTLEGYTSKDIAEQYGVEPSTVTSWISRARSKLKNEPEILNLLNR